jgi:microcin-processing peptidase 2. Unknown type peptidase. MEROPS family U62
VRAISGEKTGFAYADQITLNALRQSSEAARSIVREQGNGKAHTLSAVINRSLYAPVNPLDSLTREDKIALLHRVDTVARAADPRVQEVNASLTGVYEQVLVAATDGTLAADIRPLVRLSISVQVEDQGKRERGSSGGGARTGYEFFYADENGDVRADAWAREAVRLALVNLSAVAAPAGTLPVVLGAGWPGVLLHEAVGHGLEGDFNRRETSVFSGKMGQLVASELCTVVDDGTIEGLRGSLAVDDEGVPGQYNVLIENGVLKGYMQDKLNARLMGVPPTGNGRRESYAHLPMPRMTNTYMLAGKSTPQDIISSVEYGIYAPNFGGGQVDITSGKFVFSTSEAYLIENGKVTTPVKGAR